MIQNLYVAIDKLKSKLNLDDFSRNGNPNPNVLGVMLSPSDGMVIRDNLIPLIKIVHVEQDVGIFHVGTLDMIDGSVTPCKPREVPHDAYKMPETITSNERISDALEQKQVQAFLDKQ